MTASSGNVLLTRKEEIYEFLLPDAVVSAVPFGNELEMINFHLLNSLVAEPVRETAALKIEPVSTNSVGTQVLINTVLVDLQTEILGRDMGVQATYEIEMLAT